MSYFHNERPSTWFFTTPEVPEHLVEQVASAPGAMFFNTSPALMAALQGGSDAARRVVNSLYLAEQLGRQNALKEALKKATKAVVASKRLVLLDQPLTPPTYEIVFRKGISSGASAPAEKAARKRLSDYTLEDFETHSWAEAKETLKPPLVCQEPFSRLPVPLQCDLYREANGYDRESQPDKTVQYYISEEQRMWAEHISAQQEETV